ncbi:thioredoxin family protein [Sutcliffiella halmapala]|uniref:thioredoxin family protein n=1 Tax=Sutcliffiella halmapala TaxID=79882 RepID=UPI00099566F1|nr:thioredoxin family protein [Sutcliffiella halmapala]
MKDWTKNQLLEEIDKNQISVIYFYTPMCGTCQVAKRMLEVTKELYPKFHYGMLDVNYIQEIAMKWEIESVPCLMIFQSGQILEKIYAFHSVEHLFQLFHHIQSQTTKTP